MSRYITRIKKHCTNTFDALQTVGGGANTEAAATTKNQKGENNGE